MEITYPSIFYQVIRTCGINIRIQQSYPIKVVSCLCKPLFHLFHQNGGAISALSYDSCINLFVLTENENNNCTRISVLKS